MTHAGASGGKTAEVNRRATKLIRRQRRAVRTITADNGTEFHAYAALEQATGSDVLNTKLEDAITLLRPRQ